MTKFRWMAGLWIVLAAAPAMAGIGVSPPPEGARVVDFTDFLAPDSFAAAVAVRGEYAPVGVEFTAAGNNGGAVLDEESNFLVTGYSPPSFLAFNGDSTLQDGGTPSMPQTLRFRHPIRYLQFNVGSAYGNTITIEAFDANDVSLGDTMVDAVSTMQTVGLAARHIAKVVITGSNGNGTVLDDLAFVLDTTLIDFDDAPAPTGFSSTTALKDKYTAQGVTFATINTFDGGAVLDEDSNFGVTGFSGDNFLAFSTTAALMNGGQPEFPEWMLFAPLVRHVEFKVAGSNGATFEITAYNSGGIEIASESVTLGSAMQTIEVTADGIGTVQMTSTGSFTVIDDLEFEIQGALIDFDDLVAPTGFSQTTALRDRYKPLGIQFRGDSSKNGGAILDEDSNFGVSGFSGDNFLAFSSLGTLQDGGKPAFPQTILFRKPIKRIDLRVGDPTGKRVTIESFNSVDQLTSSTYVDGTAKMQSVFLEPAGTTRVEITSTGGSGVIDDIGFDFVDPCAHDICAAGDPLDRNCDACATIVCDNNADCCGDDWSTECAKSVSMLCEVICLPICGDANDDRKVSAPDALLALKTSVGTASCSIDRCDYSGDGSVKAADALLILKAAVGQPTLALCPLPIE